MSMSIPLSSLEGGAPAAKFENVGDKYVGIIESMVERQQTDIGGKPLFFDSGDPRMQWVITIKPDGQDAVAFYCKGGKFAPSSGSGESLLNAIGTAVRNAGASSVDVGARLAVAFTGLGEPKPGMSPPKLYTAQYEPKAQAAVAVEDLFQ